MLQNARITAFIVFWIIKEKSTGWGWGVKLPPTQIRVNIAFHNARLQGLALLKTNSNNIPFVTTYYDNVNNNKKV